MIESEKLLEATPYEQTERTRGNFARVPCVCFYVGCAQVSIFSLCVRTLAAAPWSAPKRSIRRTRSSSSSSSRAHNDTSHARKCHALQRIGVHMFGMCVVYVMLAHHRLAYTHSRHTFSARYAAHASFGSRISRLRCTAQRHDAPKIDCTSTYTCVHLVITISIALAQSLYARRIV